MSEINETHQKILHVADKLFTTKGYKAVTLREITNALGMKHTALYYYASTKEALYMQVMERNFNNHRQQMEQVLTEAGDSVKAQMQAIAYWLLSQPPVSLGQMMQSDFVHLQSENVNKLVALIFDALRLPLEQALQKAKDAGVVSVDNPGLAAISFISLVETVNAMSPMFDLAQRQAIVDNMIEMLLYGLLTR